MMANARAIFALLLCVFLLDGCAGLRRKDLDHAQALAVVARSTALTCDHADACAEPSPLRALGDRAVSESSTDKPVNYVEIIDFGQDSLLGRINLIRGARSSIDIQTFILGEDDAGFLTLNELIAAARRGVKVRLIVDQLNAPTDLGLLANLATVHANFQMRLYNPTFGRARTSAVGYVASILCCFHRFNQRMHNKLMVVDGRVAFTGGRNISDPYFDWSPDFDFLDRDALLAGPEVGKMEREFNLFWNSPRSVPLARLKDVARLLLANQGAPKIDPIEQQHRSPRVLALAAAASDQAEIGKRLVADARAVDAQFIGDGPRKQTRPADDTPGRTTNGLHEIIEGARTSVVMQTPYLVLSKEARTMFRDMHQRANAPQVTISTNSLASTDAIPVYALSYKYKRRYLRELGFHIFELKPHPLDVPIDFAATGAPDRPRDESGNASSQASETAGVQLPEQPETTDDQSNENDTPPQRLRVRSEFKRFPGLGYGSKLPALNSAGVRISLHSKAMVIDGAIGIIGSHNFDPRSDHYNTEDVLVFRDAMLAQRLQDSILRDTAPQNAWLIARRPPSAVSRINGRITALFENLPVFDFWPFRYATSYELNPGCDPVPPKDPRFDACWTPVGDFPGVDISFKTFATRVLTAFGAGLAPIL
ncbi:MAG: phospholipase D family protein [Lysobacteraceae bacterium]